MPKPAIEKQVDIISRIWEAQRERVRHYLLSMTRDWLLTEDLLQETYLRAHAGIATFRDGDGWAWLATIAKHVYFAHRRRASARQEIPLDADLPALNAAGDPACALNLLELRQAILALPPLLKQALILKHYGGLSYQEIAAVQSCPPGTAKWRVSMAIGRLRTALGAAGKEKETMTCAKLTGARLLDYVHGALPAQERAASRDHLAVCPACRLQEMSLRKLTEALDQTAGELTTTSIHVVDAHGGAMSYHAWGKTLNTLDHPVASTHWILYDTTEFKFLVYDGQELPLQEECRNGREIHYNAPLPKPVQPGEAYGAGIIAAHPHKFAESLGPARWRIALVGALRSVKESGMLTQIILPGGAHVDVVEPVPTTISTDAEGRPVLTWRPYAQDLTSPVPAEESAGVIEYSLL